MLRLSVRPGDRIEDAPAFDVHVAGSEANVAYAAARVGLRAAWASVLPDNPLGRRVVTTLAGGGAAAIRDVAPLLDVLICTQEDARDLFGVSGAPDLGVETVVLTRGAEGVVATRAGASIERPGHAVETVDRVGAGDAFAAGLVWGL